MSKDKFKLLIDAVVQDKNQAEKIVAEDPKIIHAKNGIGETVLHYLAVEDRQQDVSWLLEKGADVNTTNEFGNTPLSESASLGYYNLCVFLIKNNADPRVKTSEGDTALSEAATNNEYKVVRLLLQYTKPTELLRDYFSSISYEVLLDQESQAAKLLTESGLKW